MTAPEDFTVAPVPDALQDRRVEITGPTSRKMVINALNSGARGFMADFEDSNSPTGATWSRASSTSPTRSAASSSTTRRASTTSSATIPRSFTSAPRASPSGGAPPARRRPVAGAFMDFGLYVHRNAEALLERGWGPYLYIPKLESQPRGGALARRVRDRRGGARARARHDQGHRPDRDDPGRVLHGRDPVRAARPRRRAERRPLGLHLLDDQALPLATGVRAAGPLRGHDDRARS